MDLTKVCAIIGCYPQTNIDSAILSLTIEGVKKQGYKTCLVSHAPVNADIQKAVNYFLYTDENELLPVVKPNFFVFAEYDNLYYQTNNFISVHSYAVFINIKNALNLLQSKEYTHFVYFESDCFLNHNDHIKLSNMLDNANLMGINYWFMNESYKSGNLLPVTSIFAGNVNYFLDLLSTVKNKEDFILSSDNQNLECFLGKKIQNTTNGVIEQINPRDCFTSYWMGLSADGMVKIPGINNVEIKIDILKNQDGYNNLGFIFIYQGVIDIEVNLFINDTMIVSERINLANTFFYWLRDAEYSDVLKMECRNHNQVLKSITMTGKEVFENNLSYIKFK